MRRPSSFASRRTQFTITHELSITGEVADQLWDAYRLNFEPLATLAVLQHFYAREEMLAEFANPRIVKIIGWSEGKPIGLAMVTNSLDDVPQISPQFIRAKYPTHAEANSIYFGILVMVSPEVRGRTLFARLYTELWQVPALAGGVLVFDICDFNREMFDTDVADAADRVQLSSVIGRGARSADLVRRRAARTDSRPAGPLTTTARLRCAGCRSWRPSSGGRRLRRPSIRPGPA